MRFFHPLSVALPQNTTCGHAHTVRLKLRGLCSEVGILWESYTQGAKEPHVARKPQFDDHWFKVLQIVVHISLLYSPLTFPQPPYPLAHALIPPPPVSCVHWLCLYACIQLLQKTLLCLTEICLYHRPQLPLELKNRLLIPLYL
uniref:Uncharacterized protein n=1 Tax=Myotis myotis TaxID=51298 RepID=A0A7J7YDM0_MYOMY|nr:hypothetical protein mMyoMyo1_011039 [Myotis myotis]